MDIELVLVSIGLSALFIAMILFVLFCFVLFGQLTVRKLRKNPKTKRDLGFEFASGWDILNVASALAMPRWLNRRLRNTPLAWLYADADVLDQNTGLFDRVLATIFYSLFLFSGTMMIVLVILDAFDVFN